MPQNVGNMFIPSPSPHSRSKRESKWGKTNHLKTFGFRLDPPPPFWTMSKIKTLFSLDVFPKGKTTLICMRGGSDNLQRDARNAISNT